MSHDVFISYASADKVIAFTICESLEKGGVKCWIAPRDIGLGGYGAAIIKAIKNSKMMVLVLSSHANQSEHVHREVERAADKGITIYPFRIEDVLPSEDLELFISSEQWLDAFPSPLEEHLEQLIENVKLLLGENGGSLPPHPPRSPWPIKLKDVGQLSWVTLVIGGLILLLIGWIWFNPWGDVVTINENNQNAGVVITPSPQVSPIHTRTPEMADRNVQPNPTATSAVVTPAPLQTTPIPVPTVVETLEDTQWEYRRLGGNVEYVWEFYPNKRFRTRRFNEGTYLPDGTWEQIDDTIIIRIGDAKNPETYKGKIRGNLMEGDFIALNPTRWSAKKIVP